ncbi:MAG: aldehyde ferredoxin oxidoreductase family protein [Chloroflexi bacterium]|nr:aldehyde ferredoxin oxidoreductase family protein [Chloroflexota bacterium]
MYGWTGTILRVDLTTGQISKLPLTEAFARKWLGGEGFGARYLWDEVGPEVEDGLDPRNLLIYTTGPLTGTLAPSSGRLEIVTKSPITNIFGDTNAGGHFAPELKNAGYDLLIISGRSEKPAYLWIDDDRVEIRDARHLWGKTVPETDEAIKKEVGDKGIQVSCIGPAGENLVRFAILMNNLSRAPGWTGCGAVAGSKKLKAVAVRGTGGVKIARPAEFEAACLKARARVRNLGFLPTMRKMGTMFLVRAMYTHGYGQIHNYNIAQCPESHLEQICGEKYAGENVDGNEGCFGCELHCSHFSSVKKGQYKGSRGGGFEYGATTGFYYAYGSPDLDFALAAAKYCNDVGMDATEPGFLLAWATDCYQRGLLTAEDTGELVLDWGDQKVAWAIFEKIVHREGFGNILAEGLSRAARAVGKGTEHFAHTIKGRNSEESSIRANYSFALSSSTSTRGGDHLKGFPMFTNLGASSKLSEETWGHPEAGDPRSPRGKARMVAYNRNICTLVDIIGSCKMPSRWLAPRDGLVESEYAPMVSAATGIDFSPEDLIKIAERVYNLERAYNARLGLTRKDDTIPEKYFQEPFEDGPLKGYKHSEEDFNCMLDEYYDYCGWDRETGWPKRKTLERLDLGDVEL